MGLSRFGTRGDYGRDGGLGGKGVGRVRETGQVGGEGDIGTTMAQGRC